MLLPPGLPPELEEWERDCLRLFGPRTVVAGVGNRDRGDDGVGPVVAGALSRAGQVIAFDCGVAPENYLGRIAALDPTDVVFIDAADLGAAAGTVRLLGRDYLQVLSPSTHAAGLAHAAAFLAEACAARCYLLAVQPAGTASGAELSAEVRDAVTRILASPVWAWVSGCSPQ
jgi:hydrogenase maturation protease